MEFSIPQFIEKEAKIVGPLTFKQFVFIGTAAGVCILLFFLLPFYLFIIATIILVGGALALAFVKIQGISLPVVIKNFFFFLFKPKVYLWKKKPTPPILVKMPETKKEEKVEEAPTLKTVKGSRLKELFTKLETKN